MFQWLIPCIKWPKNAIFWLKGKNITLFKDERVGFKFSPNTVSLSLEWVTIWDIKEVCRSKNANSTTILLKYGPIWIRCMEAVFWLLVVEMSQEKNSKKKPIILSNFCFLFHFQIFNMTRDNITWFLHTYIIISSIFPISQLLVVKMSWGKKSK